MPIRRRRPVRREPLLTRLASFPLDYLTYVQEDWLSLDWEGIQRWARWPAALTLNALYLFVKYTRHTEAWAHGRQTRSIWQEKDTYERALRYPLRGKRMRRSAGWAVLDDWLWWSEVALLGLSLLNALYLAVQVGIFSVMDENTVYYLLPLAVALAAQMCLFARAFQQQGRDRQVVFGQVLHEYNEVYVHPRLQCIKYEVSTQTGEGPDGSCQRYVSSYA
ncbi:hypothetical protein BJ684DRAFT_19610 [Piptocephalis cylindrospora]|uniref:Uncharacterized protein n=1 Tax=Piptocephalis cylindrospora TaxID=1907219 RepID=A0A4P9Y4P4_9FUNG|nr:hypothetical protein BJ684DRAFT_19610 [Piptocephalis cylindrospora]|eukprot:RKP13948.1 hypothetical protein BJ684DRAFT_19610 [Piptocephalis cylindrospora]